MIIPMKNNNGVYEADVANAGRILHDYQREAIKQFRDRLANSDNIEIWVYTAASKKPSAPTIGDLIKSGHLEPIRYT